MQNPGKKNLSPECHVPYRVHTITYAGESGGAKDPTRHLSQSSGLLLRGKDLASLDSAIQLLGDEEAGSLKLRVLA